MYLETSNFIERLNHPMHPFTGEYNAQSHNGHGNPYEQNLIPRLVCAFQKCTFTSITKCLLHDLS